MHPIRYPRSHLNHDWGMHRMQFLLSIDASLLKKDAFNQAIASLDI